MGNEKFTPKNQSSRENSTDNHYPHYNRKVLYIEDDNISQYVAKKSLIDLGCVFSYENSTQAALERVKSQYFDLVITDIGMPGMSGVDFTREIRHLEKSIHANTPIFIIGLTAHQLDKIRQDCINAGMNDVIAKPFDLKKAEIILEKLFPIESKETKKPKATLTTNKQPPLYALNEYQLIDENEGIKIVGNKASFNKLLSTMVPLSILKGIADLRLAHLKHDWKTIYNIENELKGNALNCAATRLRYACENFENYYEAGNNMMLEKLFQQLMHTLIETQTFILHKLEKDKFK